MIEHRLHRLLCPRCSTSTCAELPQGVETSYYGPRLSSLVGLLGSAFPLTMGKTSEPLDQFLGSTSIQPREWILCSQTLA